MMKEEKEIKALAFAKTECEYSSQLDDLYKGFYCGYEQAEKDIGWISVNDRLPDTTEYVFTCIKMNGIPQCVGFHYYKDGKWWEGHEEDTVGAVEYWMQIPKFEEEKK